MIFYRTTGLGLVSLLAGCVTPPGGELPSRPTLTAYTSLPVIERNSPNFGVRRPNYVVLHHTADDSAEDSLRTLTTPRFEVSSHYLIGRDGKIYYLVDELARAWHAGEGYWSGNTDLNSVSIGIELDNNGKEPFADVMIDALLALLADVKARYKIPAANFVGHGDIVPGRKVDPSRYFPWKRLAENGFGIWCDSPNANAAAAANGASDTLLLSALGYDVTNFKAATAAFKRHFLGVDDETPLGANERTLLQCLIERKQAR
jgi:N-acetylmuramoyl-L-alanine amidase